MSSLNVELSPTPEQDLRLLLDHAPDAIGRFDRQLRHVYVNEATARANGRKPEDFNGKSMEDLGHSAEICELINSNLRHVFDTGKERTIELLFKGPGGHTYFQSRMAPEFNSAGDVQYVLVVSRDISEQRRAEAALVEAGRRAAAVEVASKLAHEINNPLAILTNSVYLLQKNSSLDEGARTVVELMAASLDRITNLSNRILTVSSETLGGPGPEPQK